MSRIEDWLTEHVNSDRFIAALEMAIDDLDKATDRVKARMELLSYVVPKVKGVDPLTPDQSLRDVEIRYVAATPPPKKAEGES